MHDYIVNDRAISTKCGTSKVAKLPSEFDSIGLNRKTIFFSFFPQTSLGMHHAIAISLYFLQAAKILYDGHSWGRVCVQVYYYTLPWHKT